MENKKTVGIALTGSFCTLDRVLDALEPLAAEYRLIPLTSPIVYKTDTRFGTAEHFRRRLEDLCGAPIWHTVSEAEPIGPQKLLDALVIAPCTGNTLAKLALGVTDTAVTMAAKATLRNERPVLIAPSTNDALAAAAKNIGALQGMRHYYFVPYGEDAPAAKPRSCVADFSKIPAALAAALRGEQLQPMLI